MCLGGETPCQQTIKPVMPDSTVDPHGHFMPRCLGGRSPCLLHPKEPPPCAPCAPGARPRRPSYAFHEVPPPEHEPCSYNRPRSVGGLPGSCQQPQYNTKKPGKTCIGFDEAWDPIHGFQSQQPNFSYPSGTGGREGRGVTCGECSGEMPEMKPSFIFEDRDHNVPSCLHEPQFRSDLFDKNRKSYTESQMRPCPPCLPKDRDVPFRCPPPPPPPRQESVCRPCLEAQGRDNSEPCKTEYIVDGIPVCGNKICELFAVAEEYIKDPTCSGQPCPGLPSQSG